MATPGTIISTAGHIGLIGWLIVGWGMNAAPLRIETMDVSVISGEEFDQLRAARTPEPGTGEPAPPAQPLVSETPPPPVAETPAETPPPPAPVTPPVSETPPPPPPPPAEAEVADTPPAPAVPEPTPPLPDLPESDTPTPPRAPTVASTLNAPPPPDAAVDDVVRDAVVPDDSAAAEVVAEEQVATAPEETTTQIVPEDLAPTTSARPQTRPSRPAPQPEPAAVAETAPTPPAPQEQAPAPPQDDVAAALESALSTPSPGPAVAAGPPMTGSERDSFRLAVNRCWNVDPGSVAARVTVEVGFSLDRDGTVRGNEVRLLSSDGDQSATNTAFEAARRAILRCQSGGYDLPADKYDQWQDVVITFDPSGMRLR
ncbi:energy transducer TonB [Yoonia sp.]|uniref:energy transducer TonB n=1 Tax=Yoonia sp. TaxID=2212373 RepID=UPI002FDA3F2E